MSVRILQDRRYPLAATPWKGGVQPYEDMKNQMPLTYQGLDPDFDPAYRIKFEFTKDYGKGDTSVPSLKRTIKYELLAHCTFDDQNRWYVVYYVAANVTDLDASWDYVIAPDRVDEFIRNAPTYYDKANTAQAPMLPTGSDRLPGLTYPASRDAWNRGVVMYPIARGRLPTKDVYTPPNEYHLWLEFKYMKLANKRFRIVPHVVGMPKPQVLYYIVMEVGASANLYVVSPHKLAEFADNVERYLFIAAATYPRSKHAANSARVLDHAMRGDWGKAFGELGNAWKEAIKDPEWWVMSFALPTSGYIIARGASIAPAAPSVPAAATAPRAIPNGVKSTIQSPSPWVITGRHGQPGRLDAIVQAGKKVVYRVKQIKFDGATTAAEAQAVTVARESHRQMIQRAADMARANGQKTFTMYGESANQQFVKHANDLAQKVGVPGSGKVIPNPKAPLPDYQVTLDASKVKANP